MAKEGNMSLYHDVLEPFRRAINTDPPKDKLANTTKLNFNESNQSIKEGLSNLLSASKRKFSIGISDSETPEKRIRKELSNSASGPPPSPWETKRIKADLIAAKAQITKLEARVNHQHTIRKEMQILFEEEKGSFEEQHKRDERALTDMEERMQIIRRREQEVKDELSEAVKEHKDAKLIWDKEKAEFHKQIGELKDKLLESETSSQEEIAQVRKDMDELLIAYEGSQQEVEMLKEDIEKHKEKSEQYSNLKIQLEKQTLELQQVSSKLKELEYERDSYKDWQQQAKTAQKRLSNMAELEKDVAHLRATERSLRDAVRNKLLLEEQVHQLTCRNEALLPVHQELLDAKVKIAALERSIEDWRSAGRSHGAATPRAMSAALDAALGDQLAAVANSSQKHSQLAQLKEELASIKFERDRASSKLKDLQTLCKNQENLIHVLQKRLLLVTRERDSYRQQLDCYEKELTVSLCGEGGGRGAAALQSARVAQLETALQEHQDALASLHTESQQKVVKKLNLEVAKWREEAEMAKRDVAKLRAQREHLQAQIERVHASGLLNASTKVLHLSENPASVAQKQAQIDLEAAQEEIARLKAAIREGGGEEEAAQLRQQLEKSKIKLQRMKEEFISSAQEYKDVCYMLLGYKIDRTGHKNYRISSMYAESADDYLTFTLCDAGIEMVHTDYSAGLEELVDMHLHNHHSIPMFLSALTFELFNRTTMQQESQ